MANPLKTVFYAIFGKSAGNINHEEIKKAEQAGAIAARNAAKRMGIVEQVEIDADKARQEAERKQLTKEDKEKTK